MNKEHWESLVAIASRTNDDDWESDKTYLRGSRQGVILSARHWARRHRRVRIQFVGEVEGSMVIVETLTLEI